MGAINNPVIEHWKTVSTFFDDLLESVRQMDEILRGERRPSRELHIDALQGQAKENRDRSNVFVEGNS